MNDAPRAAAPHTPPHAPSPSDVSTVAFADLSRLVAGLFVHAGLGQADAAMVADSLAEANLRGTDSHGVARAPHYLRRIRAGSIEPRPDVRVVHRRGAVAIVDGGHGLGQVVNAAACDEAIRLARANGAGWVAIRNSSHCGALAYFGRRIARSGMIAIAFSHVDPMVLPHGSAAPFHGTNPICIAVPAEGDDHFCLDMATSAVPWNIVANARLEGKQIAPGLAVDVQGHETTDPAKVHALYPMGGVRGSGLGLAIDLLSSALGGSPFGPHIPKMYGDLTQRRRLGGLVGAIDPAAFGDPAAFRAHVQRFLNEVRGLPPRPPVTEVMVPGDPELRRAEERGRTGIPLPRAVTDELDALAKDAGIALLNKTAVTM
ncbi:MAG: Ldh family oxidoreductase [Planctomycetota bacterium]|nr:Ldh family oxidoreductase [Planctomycetota bacterium]